MVLSPVAGPPLLQLCVAGFRGGFRGFRLGRGSGFAEGLANRVGDTLLRVLHDVPGNVLEVANPFAFQLGPEFVGFEHFKGPLQGWVGAGPVAQGGAGDVVGASGERQGFPVLQHLGS